MEGMGRSNQQISSHARYSVLKNEFSSTDKGKDVLQGIDQAFSQT